MTTIGTALAEALGADRVAEDPESLAAHRLDYWFLAHLRNREGRLGAGPACIVSPRSTAEVATTLRTAQRLGTPVVPFGGGSGVLGGAVGPAGALVLDTRRLDRLLELNETALWARAQAGMMGDVYEHTVTARGYTTGNYPQSIARSTIGGWVATRAAGQFSTRYGNIEDLLLGLEAVLPSGEVVRVKTVPRAAAGPSLREIFLGSEGTLGVVTEVTFRVHPLAERRDVQSFALPSFHAGLEAIRRMVRVGWRPAVVRLYDAPEAMRHFGQWMPAERAALLVLSEGPSSLVAAEMAACTAEATAQGGEPCGPEPVTHWLGHRNEVPSWDFFLEREIVVDTIEIAADWDRVGGLYDSAIAALQQVPGLVVGSAHSSHSYPQGTNLYITFVVKPPDWAQAEAAYLDAWTRTMEAALAAGGTIAHHHGVGRLRTPWLEREWGTAYPILVALKRALDPTGLMNPGVLV